MLYLSPETPFDSSDEDAIVVLRVVPQASVTIVRGTYDRDGWISKGMGFGSWFMAEEGFIVAQVTPTDEMDNDAFAVVQVRPERYTSRADEPAFTYTTARWSPVVKRTLLAAGIAAGIGTVGDCLVYSPKGEAHMPVFRAAAGRVNYVGAIRIDASRGSRVERSAEGNRHHPDHGTGRCRFGCQFLAKRYPRVHARIAKRPLRMMRRNEYID